MPLVKFQNWNRFYDPSIGRYLEPEPMLQDPQYVSTMAGDGYSVPAYAYALKNPLANVDLDGRKIGRIDWGLRVAIANIRSTSTGQCLLERLDRSPTPDGSAGAHLGFDPFNHGVLPRLGRGRQISNVGCPLNVRPELWMVLAITLLTFPVALLLRRLDLRGVGAATVSSLAAFVVSALVILPASCRSFEVRNRRRGEAGRLMDTAKLLRTCRGRTNCNMESIHGAWLQSFAFSGQAYAKYPPSIPSELVVASKDGTFIGASVGAGSADYWIVDGDLVGRFVPVAEEQDGSAE